MQKSKTLFWGLIVLIVLVLIILLAGRERAPKVDTNENGEVVEEIAPGQEKATAGEGSIVSGFPISFILFDEIRVLESYSIAYNDLGAKQPVVEYAVMMESNEVADAYRTFFEENSWTLTSDISSPEDSAAFLYATKNSMDASVNIATINGESKVVVAYVERN